MNDIGVVSRSHVRIHGALPEMFLRKDLVAAALGQPTYDADDRQRFARRFRLQAGKLHSGASVTAQDDTGLRTLFEQFLGWRGQLRDAGEDDIGDLGLVPAGERIVLKDVADDDAITLGLVLRAPWRTDLDRKQPHARFNVSWTDTFERVLANRGLGWGIITSGNCLRLVRRGTAARAVYVEFDLLAISDDLDASDSSTRVSAQEAFDLLLMLARASAFEPKERAKKGTITDHTFLAMLADEDERQVGKDLGHQVYPALEWILRGLVEHSSNRIGPGCRAIVLLPGDPVDTLLAPGGVDLRQKDNPARYDEDALRELDRQGLIFLYRLLFLFMADARELTPQHPIYQRGYAARTIARDAIRAWDRGSEPERHAAAERVATWLALKATFRIARDGAALPDSTNLSALNGNLFAADEAPLLEVAVIGERHLVEALRRLTRRQVRGRRGERSKWLPIEFARLDIERLGSVYEGLLDFEPRVAEEALVELKIRTDQTIVVRLDDTARVLAGLDEMDTAKKAAKKDEADASVIVEEEADDTESSDTGESDEDTESLEDEAEDEDDDEVDDIAAGVAQEEEEEAAGCPREILGHRRFVRSIPNKRFYLAPTGARRKGSGSYYTPVALTTWLVRETLSPLVQGKTPDEILRLRVVDPAMGSAAFLVAACRFLGEAYTRATVTAGILNENQITDELRAEHRRLVAEHCLFGVDVNPMAVELGRVSLWLETLAKDRPLTFLRARLRPGNSLIGARFADIDTVPTVAFDMVPRSASAAQKKLQSGLKRRNTKELASFTNAQTGLPGIDIGTEVKNRLPSIRAKLVDLLGGPSDTVEQVRQKNERYDDLRESSDFVRLKQTLDLWSAIWFWPVDAAIPRPTTGIYHRLLARIWSWPGAREDIDGQTLTIASDIAKKRRFFHWELEFPEAPPPSATGRVQIAGFNVVIGNPPWDKIKADPRDFFPSYDPLFRSYKRNKVREAQQQLLSLPEIAQRWQKLIDDSDVLSLWSRTAPGYENQIGGREPNIYRAFGERAVRTLQPGGRFGFVLPGSICAEDGGFGLRKLWLLQNNWKMVRVFENHEGIFPIHRSFKFGAFVVEAGGVTSAVDAAFMLRRFEQLDVPGEAQLALTIPFLESFSGEKMAMLEFRRGADVPVAEKLWHAVRMTGGSWPLKFGYDVHTRNDRIRAGVNFEGQGYPCLENKLFWQYDLEFSTQVRWCDTEKVRALLEGREVKRYRAAWKKLLGTKPPNDVPELPIQPDGYRLGYRDIARNTDERTLIVALLPPGWVTSDMGTGSFAFKFLAVGNTLQHTPLLSNREWLVACGLMNSFVCDFAMRLLNTGTDVKHHHLHNLPLLRMPDGSRSFHEISVRSARLSCVTEEFATLWSDVMGSSWARNVGASGEDRRILRAEIDAIVARLYGLSLADLAYVMDSFDALRNKEQNFLTKRLVLSAFDRLQPDFTFAPASTTSTV